MKMTFRWYGENDEIPLQYIRQIPGMTGVVTAVYSVAAGGVWPETELFKLKSLCETNGLSMEVIESIPVHEDIKMGLSSRGRYIENYQTNIRLAAKAGVKCVCYNFMPVFDWLRTDLDFIDRDGSSVLSYSSEDFAKLDPTRMSLPGWDESYTPDEVKGLLSAYGAMTRDKLFDNFIYFLRAVIPVAEEVGINMAVHPDDPPWPVFGIPRIVSDENDLDKIFDAVPSKRNGLTLCTGSFGAGKNNDLIHMAKKYARQGRVHFVHLRNVLWTDERDSFREVAHLSKCGSVDMAGVVKALSDNGFTGFVRPDHGRNIWGEKGKPGYGLYDRALGAAYINGLFEMADKARLSADKE